MNDKTDATISVLAAMLVLFTAMLDPLISAGVAVVFLVGWSIYKVRQKSAK